MQLTQQFVRKILYKINMSPKYGRYYEVIVSIEAEDEKGKLKKQSVKYLIDAVDTAMAEANTMKLMEGTMGDWEIIDLQQ